MYFIRWFDGECCNSVCGTLHSIVALAHLFERDRQPFKVVAASGSVMSREALAMTGFDMLLEPEAMLTTREK